MLEDSQKNKRIAKNTLLLYVRTLFSMLISLYTSRVILQTLGVKDYGIYNVVGGVVTMFSILSGSLSAAISRFITYELGKGDTKKLSTIFSSVVNIQIGLSLIIVLLAETIGLWFLNVKMNIPADRMYASNWVYQLSILTFVLGLISVPYSAVIVAYERMSTFAYIGIFETTAKLVVVYMLLLFTCDKLILFATLMAMIALIIRFIYGVYCKRHFEECNYKFVYDNTLFKKMFSFAGWNFLGAGSALLMSQGVNILMNMFFGVTLNVARGIANQVDNAVQQFVNNFTTAINPQITKSYATDNLSYMHQLVSVGSKYSFFLTWFFALPILLETNRILSIWLKVVPEYSVLFLKLTIGISLISVISNTLVTSMLATGDIKKYQIIVGGLGMTIFPLVYIAYKIGLPPATSYLIHMTIFIAQLCFRLYLLRNMIKLPIMYFVKNTLLPDVKVLLASSFMPLLLLYSMQDTFFRFLVICIVCVCSTIGSIYIIGLTKSERALINQYMLKFKARII